MGDIDEFATLVNIDSAVEQYDLAVFRYRCGLPTPTGQPVIIHLDAHFAKISIFSAHTRFRFDQVDERVLSVALNKCRQTRGCCDDPVPHDAGPHVTTGAMCSKQEL